MNLETQLKQFNLPKLAPGAYALAAFWGYRFGCSKIIDVGQQAAGPPPRFHRLFQAVGLEYIKVPASDLSKRLRAEPLQPGTTYIPPEVLQSSIIVVTNVDQLAHLLPVVKNWMDYAPLGLLTFDGGTLAERVLCAEGFNLEFVGLINGANLAEGKNTGAAVLGKNRHPNPSDSESLRGSVPPDFRVVAFMAVYNEADIITESLSRLIDQGIDVHLIDNWSTDGTRELASQFLGRGLVGLETFPAGAPPIHFSLRELLRRVEELSSQTGADWLIHHDADEIRTSPWPNLNLREAIYKVDREGFNCIDQTVLMFPPVDDGFRRGLKLEEHFRYCEFGKSGQDFLQIKSWKNFGRPVTLASSGGHEVRFAGRRIYPFKFLTKHYQVRSQTHGEKKVLDERKNRWDPVERAAGWHTHYNEIDAKHNFLRAPSELISYEEDRFNRAYLAERLTGIGALL